MHNFEQHGPARDLKQGGWFRIQNELVDVHGARIGPDGIALLAVLSRHADNDTSEVRGLSIRRIQNSVGRKRTWVFKMLKKLEEEGLIARRFTGRESNYLLLDLKNRPAPYKRQLSQENVEHCSRSDGASHRGTGLMTPREIVAAGASHNPLFAMLLELEADHGPKKNATPKTLQAPAQPGGGPEQGGDKQPK